MPSKSDALSKIERTGQGGQKSAILTTEIKFIDAINPSTLVLFAEKFPEAVKTLLKDMPDGTEVNLIDWSKQVSSLLLSLVCPVCNGAKEVGVREKKPCPACQKAE